MKFLERSRPKNGPVLQIHAVFTRLAVGEPYLDARAFQDMPLLHGQVTRVEAAGEWVMVEMHIPVEEEVPLEIITFIGLLAYPIEVGKAASGKNAPTSAGQYITCMAAKAQWLGTTDWEIIRQGKSDEANELEGQLQPLEERPGLN